MLDKMANLGVASSPEAMLYAKVPKFPKVSGSVAVSVATTTANIKKITDNDVYATYNILVIMNQICAENYI